MHLIRTSSINDLMIVRDMTPSRHPPRRMATPQAGQRLTTADVRHSVPMDIWPHPPLGVPSNAPQEYLM